MVKAIWAVACTVLAVAGLFAIGSGCTSANSQIRDFSGKMDIGEGPGATFRELTELQKDVGGRPVASHPAQGNSSVPVNSAKVPEPDPTTAISRIPPTTGSTPKASLERDPPKSKSTSSPSANTKGLPASAEQYLRSLDSVTSSVPSRKPSENKVPKTTVAPATSTPKSVPPSGTPLTITKSVSKEPSPEKIPPAPQAQSSSKAKVESSGTPLTITKSVSKESSPEKIPPAPQAQSSSPAKARASDSTQYRIGPEDLLHVSVWGNEELTNDVVVRPDGKISLPLVQDIQAEGFTASELADSIHRKLLPFIKGPNVSVIVRQINSPKFSVLGYVARPGTFPLRGDVTVLQALSEAGGFTPFASPKKIKLIRNADGKQDVRIVNYYKIIKNNGEGNYLLKPGDAIVVP